MHETPQTQARNEPVWDKVNSTYMRNIYLVNGYVFTGYSKKYKNNERKDKIDLLTNWILRDLKNGYLDEHTQNPKITETNRIEYFEKKGSDYIHIITLYYQFAYWENQSWMDNHKFSAFIARFYDMIEKKIPVAAIVNALEIRTRAPKADPFSIEHPRFLKVKDLNAYVLQLRREGKYPMEEIENFYRKYLNKYSPTK